MSVSKPIKFRFDTIPTVLSFHDDPDDEGGDETPTNVTHSDLNQALAAHSKRLINKMTDLVATSNEGAVTMDQLKELLSSNGQEANSDLERSQETVKKIETPPQTPTPVVPNDGMRVEMTALKTQMAQLEKEKKELVGNLDREKTEARSKEKDMHILRICENQGCGPKSQQVLTLIRNDIADVPDKGFMAKVETDLGDDLQDVGAFVTDYLKTNPHFLANQKSGSGGRVGGDSGSTKEFDFSKMSIDDYAKDREAIHKKADTERGR